MDRTADLETALKFVIRRIEEEAARSGLPLTAEQSSLLNHLPKTSALPMAHHGDPGSSALFLPRDTDFERLCALAKTANHHDLALNPASSCDWEFAAAVFKLNHHPMSWLLNWAGVKERRPWWDGYLLFFTALLVVSSFVAVTLGAGKAPLTRFQWTEISAAYLVIFILIFSVSRQIEDWQLRQTIEISRRYATVSRY